MFFDDLQHETAAEREALMSIPIVQRALRGDVAREEYLAFLAEAYHHVRHTVPLLMACGMRLPERLDWLRGSIVEYIADEAGHDQWILGDIARAGGDAVAVRDGQPRHATEVMVAYAYDGVLRRNPLVFFGMGFVLEGTSVGLATKVAAALQQGLGLPDDALTYLRTHGDLDVEHTHRLAGLINRLDATGDRAEILRAARAFYRLYGDVFRSIPSGNG